MKAFLFRFGARQGNPFWLVSFNRALKALAGAFREKEEVNIIEIGKEEVKLYMFEEDMILSMENITV